MAKPIKINIVDSCGCRVCCNNNNNKAQLQQINFAVYFVVVPLAPVVSVDFVVAVVARVALAVHQKQKFLAATLLIGLGPETETEPLPPSASEQEFYLYLYVLFFRTNVVRVRYSARARRVRARARAVERVRERERECVRE